MNAVWGKPERELKIAQLQQAYSSVRPTFDSSARKLYQEGRLTDAQAEEYRRAKEERLTAKIQDNTPIQNYVLF